MAYLLGNESCIEGLRSDLQDIQETIDEILVRAHSNTESVVVVNGSTNNLISSQIRCYSWKSPDKLATELKIKELLDRYKHGPDDTDNQVAHYSLLELIIDRLLLLIYLSGRFMDTTLEKSEMSDKKTASSSSSPVHLNAGLAVKKYWNKFIQLNTACVKQHAKQKQLSSEQPSKTSTTTTTTTCLPNSSSTPTPSQTKSNANTIRKSSNCESSPIACHSGKKIADETSNKFVQTVETAFVPCDSCAKVQANLKQNADQLINMCHYQNIVSQVGKFRSSLMANQIVGGWLNGQDLEKWLLEQDKDLNRISKQLEYLSKNNELLKSKLTESEDNLNKAKNIEKDLRKNLKDEENIRTTTVKHYEKKVQDQKFEMQSTINSLENELRQLKELKNNLEERIEHFKSLNDNNEKIINELTEANKSLNEEASKKKEELSKIHRNDEELLVKTTELDCLKRELTEKTAELNKEREKLEALIKNEQSLKLKYESLIESSDKLEAEAERLRKRSANIEELENSVHAKQQQIESLEDDMTLLHKSVNELRVELKKKSDNEVLLLKYPDLYGPLENVSENETNVLEDMLNQVNANKHRMSLLENLNQTLMTSIRKLNEANVNKNNSNENSRKPSIDIQYENSQYKSQQQQHHHQQQHRYAQNVSRNENEESFSRSSNRRQHHSPNQESKFPPRPVPLFKLDNELSDPITNKPLSADKTFKKTNWTQNESIVSNGRQPKSNSVAKEHSSRINSRNSFDYETLNDFNNNNNNNVSEGFDANNATVVDDYNNDDEFNFLKDKDESNKRLLEELNMISKTSELKDYEDFNYMKMRRNIPSSLSKLEDQSYLNSPTSVGNSTLRNHPQTPNLMIQNSRIASYSPSSLNRQANSRAAAAAMTPIPPADKNMEVIVGKGRRVNSASGSARSNSNSNHNNATTATTTINNNNNNSNKATNGNVVTSIPPTPTANASKTTRSIMNSRTQQQDSHRSNANNSRISDFRCKKCEKAYNNLRDFDIHKLYCN